MNKRLQSRQDYGGGRQVTSKPDAIQSKIAPQASFFFIQAKSMSVSWNLELRGLSRSRFQFCDRTNF
ncbi:MAG: hypothetical protein HLUCCA11_22375 [Phormidesmis priestleyi Ana]|uniref:Uncharacterized protein n=1 Tax=Phormidesmis priestleyi Ana TaxID=1666911 RepID=A0A0N8KLW5_9CYAN|nr:MAG: hypothetical protein HLUCCA11_22375 [Phormidesmis priestleyi Ana]